MRRALVLLLVAAALPAGVARPADPEPELPKVGDTVSAFTAKGIDGTDHRFAFPAKGRSQVLLFFLSSCPTCHKMIPEWNLAYDRRGKGLEVTGVIMDQEPPGFFSTMPISFPVVRNPGKEFAKVMKINRVPITMRVGPGGKIEDVKVGMIDPITLGDIFRP